MSETTNAVPNPGSQAAIDKGCTCAVMDNHHGRGVQMRDGNVNYWISGDCPVHAKPRSGTNAT
jgi:hypothetical protein